jgi:hypothetical protein
MGPDDNLRQRLSAYLKELAPGDDIAHQAAVEAAEQVVIASLVQHCVELTPEIVGGGGSGSLGMMLVRKRQRLAYSIKFSNFMRDPIVSTNASALWTFAAVYIPSVAADLPPTFPGFLIGVGFALLRTIAHPIGYGEAALLHRMVQLSEMRDYLTRQDLVSVGNDLVEIYGYVKGNNSYEVASLLISLESWNAIESVPNGYRVLESVPFGLGPIQYVD